ncbi:hypothetical protein AAE478_007277 [Parahypoxylon ruwenzoriense]
MELRVEQGGLSILNPSPSLVKGPHLLHDLVAGPSSDGLPAIDYFASTGDRSIISYSHLHAVTTSLATRISEVLGSIDPEEQLIIPILMPQSPALYVGLIAILKAGAAFCPLNLDAPRERIKFILRDVDARLVLTCPEFTSRIPVDEDGVYEVMSISQSLDVPIRTTKLVPCRVPRAGDLAYVMYTSGSTGTPKGVAISHLAVTQSLLAHDRHIPPFSRFLQFAAPTFDVSVFEVFFPMFRGRTLVCCGRSEMLTDLPGVLKAMQVDACELTPSVASSLLKKRSNAPGLCLLLTIGEMLTEPVIQEFGGDKSDDSLLWGMYGPTEVTIHCTIQPAFLKKFGRNNIGVPLDTVSSFVIDSDTSEFQIIPLGCVGELAIGGCQIATGYINRPEQSSVSFIDTCWGRIYRTGDKARMLADGTIECLGRIGGGQVKLNGQRIELGELEHALLRTPGCHSAFAAVISNILVAFAAVEDVDAPELRAAIFAQCRSWLPAFMVPADIRIMQYFPLLPSGKVDKKVLIERYETLASNGLELEEQFEDRLECQLCEIAQLVLGQRTAPSIRLSSMGLDSLAAIEYASMIRTMGIVISPIDILDVATIRELSRLVAGRRDTVQPPRSAVSSEDGQIWSLPESDGVLQPYLNEVERFEMCTALQESMIVETFKDSRLYVNQIELRFPSHVGTKSIASWLSVLAQRNENLRTGFVHIDHQLRQVIWKRLEEDQIEIVSGTTRPFECVDVELFLRRPFKAEIVPAESPADDHMLRFTLHHSIYDGWTIDLMVEDLSLLAKGKPPVDRPQFRQILQHLAAVGKDRLMDAKEFWAEKLRGCILTPLPNFRTTSTPNPQITMISRDIDVNPARVRDFALGVSIGPQVLFQACLAWLWGAVNGVDDVIIGSVSSGRTLAIDGIEKIMGPCMVTLPLRVIFSRYRTIPELLQGIHMSNREALRHDGFPLPEIKRAAGAPLAQKLFDVIFSYQETLVSRKWDNGIIREARHRDSVEAKLLFEISPLDNRFSCHITWHSEAFSEPQVDTLFRHLECLINYVVQNGEEVLGSISGCFPITSLSRYNENPKHEQLLPSLAALVESTASRFPTREALCFASSITASHTETNTLTYQELNARANQIGRYLQESGAVPGGVIALVMEKSPLLYCAILGILKAGCAYLPILPSTPPQRIRLILEQARPRFCIVDDTSPGQITEATVNLACPTLLYEYSDFNLEVPGADPSSLAYVIYTSGTTGAPKGVSVTNENILSNIEVLSRIYPHESSGRMLQSCSQAFDVSVFEIFFSWGNGLCLCSATNDTLFEDIERAIRKLNITHLSMTVTVASLIEPSRVPNVKFLVTSGEPMTDRVLDRWAEHLWQGQLFSAESRAVLIHDVGYGPSEMTNICTVRKVSRQDSPQYLGWSFENTSAFVLSPDSLELVPLGCVGELCFGGDQVAAGYLEMPEMTVAKFFEHREYGRLYRSGDFGRMLPDGSLIILGRMDSQVKLRGLRIELLEIQAIALKSGFVDACASVLVTLDGTSSQQLALFYIPVDQEPTRFSILPLTDPARQTTIILLQTLQATLPAYMVPSFIFPISSLPTTPSGKVDHELLCRSVNELPGNMLSLCSSAQGPVDPDSLGWTETETLVSKAISETLHLDRKVIRRWSSFASLGIDSISAMPLARRLQTIFQRRIPLSLILQNSSVGRLASVITGDTIQSEEKTDTTLLPKQLLDVVIQRFAADWGSAGVENVLPCTPLQEAMLSSSPDKAGTSYCNQMLFRLQLPSQAMAKYWNTMFERHGILRTCFVTTEDVGYPLVQVVLKNSYSPTWQTFEVDGVSFREHVLNHRNSLPVAIDSGEPPISLALFLVKGSIEYLSFVCHHAIYDGVSIRNLLSEIEASLRHESLPTPATFESFLQETLSLPPGSDDFWTEHFRSFSPFHFEKSTSSKDANPKIISTKASSRSFSSIIARLRDLGVSLLPFCQAAWAVTLSLLQNNSDVCFGNVISGRSIDLDNIDKLVAPCFNTVPVRMNLDRAKFPLEVMKKFQQLNTEMLPYQFTGLRRIQSLLPLSNLFDTILILQPPLDPLDRTIWSLEEEHGTMDTSSLIIDIFQYAFNACLELPSSCILSASQLPARWQHEIAQLPLSQELPRVDTSITIPGSSTNGDWTEAETKVRSVLSRLVKTPEEKIGRHTSIYRYGLDSIGAVQLATLLRREAYTISAVDVIENPTCEGIASRLKVRNSKEDIFTYDFNRFRETVGKTLPAKTYEAVLPCTPTQQGMISQFFNSDGTHYFNFSSWAVDAEIDVWVLAGAWSCLAARHQILRTGFVPVDHQDSSYAMVVYPEVDSSIPVSVRQSSPFDVSEWRKEAASKAFREHLLEPPWQVLILDCAPSRPIMHLAIHHALYDANSLDRLLRELVKRLSGVVGEGISPLLPVLSAHLDPAHSQTSSEAFWRGKAGDLVVNKFPIMTPLRTTSRISSTTSKICSASSRTLRRNAAEAGITMRAALQAAWARMLSAYLGEMSVTFGIVLDGRTTEEERNVIFPTVVTLPVVALNYKSNVELLEYMMQYNTNLRQYEKTPLSKVQRWLGRPDGHLFDTILAYQTTPGRGSIPWEVLDEMALVEYAVALEVVDTVSEELKFNITYDTDILPVEQANILLRQFDAVLVDLLASPWGNADELASHTPGLFSILPAACERLTSPAELLHQLVEQSARRIPTTTALEFVEELSNSIHQRHWTYRELDEMGNRVADMLLDRNTPSGSIVATCFNKCPEAYFSILGILKAGCAFLSLDPGAPASRLEFILDDSAATCLLTEDSGLNLNTTIPIYVVREHQLRSFSSTYQKPPRISSSDICYCLYTSGTTGTPKGCLISHGNAVQAMLAFKQLFIGHWDERSRWLQFASFHFDVSVLEQYWSWFVGITLVAAPRDFILSDIAATISRLDITHIDLTPSLARLIHPDEVPSLCRGVFITGGEQLRQEILQVWGPKRVIYNAYGPTEATIGVTMFQRVPSNGKSSNIGTQFPNVGTYVFQPGTEVPVLRGGAGELCISGRLVGQGYLNRKYLTEERFPVLKRYDERVYRTGDLVRILHDGSFDFLGRADDQVKLRGQRLEIGEIDHTIRAGLTHQLADVATFVTKRTGQDRELLVSFIAPTASQFTGLEICFDQHSLRMSQTAIDACRDHLPGYMVPAYVVCVSSIPLSANNKADIKRLKHLFAELPHHHLQNFTGGSASTQRELSETEQLISAAISAVTHTTDTQIFPSSSIFELGIDSINVARLAMILQTQNFQSASPSVILRHPQISSLSQALRQTSMIASNSQALQVKQSIRALYHRHIGIICRALEIPKTDVEYIAPCTPLQEGIVTRSKAAEDQSPYFNQFRIDMDPHISVSRLRGCWDSAFAEYAILRTAFIETADGYIQVAFKQKAIRWFEIGGKEEDIGAFISERRRLWIVSNRDTLRYPIEIDHFEHLGKQVLLIRLFHAVYDGRSFELLLRNVNAKYHRDLPLRSPTFIDVLPYGPLLKYSRSRPFWEETFKGYTFQPMQSLSRELGIPDASLSRVFRIKDLDTRRTALGVTYQTVLQAAWLIVLHQRLGFVPTIGVVFSGRSLVLDRIENVIGPLFSTLPFRVELARHPTWASLIRGVQEYNTSVLEFVHTPLRDIQKWCSNGQQLFDTLFTFEREDAFTMAEKPFWSSIDSVGTADYPLTLEITLSRDNSLRVDAVGRQDISTLRLLLDGFGEILEALAGSDDDTRLPLNPTTDYILSPMSNSPHRKIEMVRVNTPDFAESDKVQDVRREVAALSGLPEKDISETANILELGLDSIDIIKLVTRLKRVGFQVTISDLLKKPIISSILSDNVTRVGGNSNTDGTIDLEHLSSLMKDCLIRDGKDVQNVKAILPPTSLQDSMVAEMVLSDFHRYFNHDVLEIPPETDIDRLKSAWITVHANSPILRTTFAEIDSPGIEAAFCQIVRDEPLGFIPTVELSSLDQITTVIEQARSRAAMANAASDLFQLTFATIPTKCYLVISIAHALYDGWSLEMLHNDVQAAYDGHYHPRVGYVPYLSRLLFNSPTSSESFWADFLIDARPTILNPVNKPRGNEPIIYRLELVSALKRQDLKMLCRRYRITPQVLAQGCWAPVLASMSRLLDVTFGVVLSGRDNDEAQGLLFPTMNTIPLRVVLHGTVVEYFNYLQATMSDITEHQHYPLREIQKLYRFQGDKLFNTLFLLQNSKENGTRSGSAISHSVYASSAVEYPICIEMEITESSVVWRVAGDGLHFSARDVNQILTQVDGVLQYFAEDHTDVLEFDQVTEKVTVCGLEPFELNGSKSRDEIQTTLIGSCSQKGNYTSGELSVMDVLSELSGIDRHSIDPNHSIYHLGLDSISAIKASSMLRKRGLNVSVRNLLKASSIYEILGRLKGDTNTICVPYQSSSSLDITELVSLSKAAGLDQAEVEMTLPALPIQVHFLSIWKNTDGLLFFPRFSYKLSGRISGEMTMNAWSRLVAESPILRTYFISTVSREVPFIQVITKPGSINSFKHHLQDNGQGEWVYESIPTPFIAVRVENPQPEEINMHLHIHHALYDSISLPAMMGRFLELCDTNSTSSLSPCQSIWCEFVSKHYSPEILKQRQKFWSSYLQDIKPTYLSTRGEQVTEVRKTKQLESFRRNAIRDISKLRKISSAHGTTLQALFFAAYSKVLASLQRHGETSLDTDIVFGIYLANRSSFGNLEEAPFPTLNIVPVVVKKPLVRSILSVAIEIQKDIFEISSFDNASIGLWEIHDWTGIQVETFVNFLIPPDSTTTRTNPSIRVTEMAAPEANKPPQHLAKPNSDSVSSNKVNDAFFHAVDIEVALHGNAVDIGVFSPLSHFSHSQAEGVIEGVVTTLEAIQEAPQ